MYKSIALLLLNTLVIFTALNIFLYPILLIIIRNNEESNPVAAKYGEDTLLKAYPDKNQGEINDMMNEEGLSEEELEILEEEYKEKVQLLSDTLQSRRSSVEKMCNLFKNLKF